MKPNEIITPDHVRWVLGIEPKGIIELTEKFIIFYGDDGYCGNWNIHEFIYLAIEKCAAERWSIDMDRKDISKTSIVRVTDTETFGCSNSFYFGKTQTYHSSWLHAQLAAIAWVYGKIQEGK